MHFSKAVVKYRIPILIIAVLLMIPSVLGMIGTRINYDMLDYLPDDMDTVIGFRKGRVFTDNSGRHARPRRCGALR